MTRRLIAPLLFGLIGAGILVGLGVWQLQRLHWKEGLLAQIDARITAAPVALPADPDPATDKYLPVTVSGRLTARELDVLTSRKNIGPGYRIVTAMVTADGRRIMVDRGFLPENRKDSPRPPEEVTVTGNLHWPDETDAFTPPPDPKANLWFARDVPAMARALGTDPVLVVARKVEGDRSKIEPMPVDTSGVPNNHRNYAITWFSLAVVWLGMTGLLLWRITRRKD
ncbi:SURF1 family protein [Acidimangrovimonas pyrenivorans]|uniref:SURF1-like protein n=1 Tax=Acidimangrovimonas pyrenivorans TaxID=2030798 RepID=A0ABV7AKS1_9RHOB